MGRQFFDELFRDTVLTRRSWWYAFQTAAVLALVMFILGMELVPLVIASIVAVPFGLLLDLANQQWLARQSDDEEG